MFCWNCNPAGFLIKRAKRRLGCPTAGRAVGNSRWQCVDLIELTGHKKTRFPFDSLVPRVFSVNAPKSPDDSMCLTLDSGASFLLNTKRLPGLWILQCSGHKQSVDPTRPGEFFPPIFCETGENESRKGKTHRNFCNIGMDQWTVTFKVLRQREIIVTWNIFCNVPGLCRPVLVLNALIQNLNAKHVRTWISLLDPYIKSVSCAKEYSDRAAASVISNPIRPEIFSDVWCLAFGIV